MELYEKHIDGHGAYFVRCSLPVKEAAPVEPVALAVPKATSAISVDEPRDMQPQQRRRGGAFITGCSRPADLSDWQSRDPRKCQCCGGKKAADDQCDCGEDQAAKAKSNRETVRQFDRAVTAKMQQWNMDRKQAIRAMARGRRDEQELYRQWLLVTNSGKSEATSTIKERR